MSITAYTDQLQKKYSAYLRRIVLGLPFETIVLRGGKNKPDTTAALHKAIQEFQQHEKNTTQPGWQIEWESWNSKALGRQQWPATITVPAEADLLHLLKQVQVLLNWKPAIQQWLAEKTGLVLSLQPAWPGIMSVTDFLLAHNVSGYYLRNLPVPVHTKFIEANKATILSLLRHLQPEKFDNAERDFEKSIGVQLRPMIFSLRWLDAALGRAHHYPAEVAGITAEVLRQAAWPMTEIWLVENETALYMLPARAQALALCSHGYALAQLANIPLFQKTPLFYWGDMDEDGFALLHQCRLLYPHTQSRFMDAATLDAHLPELHTQPAVYKRLSFPTLTPEEQAAYERLLTVNGRVEQERVRVSEH
jgi:hypothetical protein